MTIKEKRKHIKPFLRFAIINMKNDWEKWNCIFGLCSDASDYVDTIKDISSYNQTLIEDYLKARLKDVQPKESVFKMGVVVSNYWWGAQSTNTKKGMQKRIDFCKLQLKIVKP